MRTPMPGQGRHAERLSIAERDPQAPGILDTAAPPRKEHNMTTAVDGYDAIRVNAGRIPKGAQAAGYDTGSGIVPWDAATWAAHPGAVHIDQEPQGTDTTADVFDVEAQAGLLSRVAPWAHAALASYRTGKRKGQRSPLIYMSASVITPVCNALAAGGISSGVGLWVAHYGIGRSAAVAMVTSGGGPYPIRAVQYDDHGPNGEPIDSDIFSKEWLQATAGSSSNGGGGSSDPPATPVPTPPSPEVRATGGNEGLGVFARYHSMTVQQVIWLTAHQKPGGYGTDQGAYISGGQWDQDMPAGSTWWIGPTP